MKLRTDLAFLDAGEVRRPFGGCPRVQRHAVGGEQMVVATGRTPGSSAGGPQYAAAGVDAGGRIYLAEGRRILGEIDDLERSISTSQGAPVGLLKVQATLGFGRSFIAPAISKFSARYPHLEIRIDPHRSSSQPGRRKCRCEHPFRAAARRTGDGAQAGQPPSPHLCLAAISPGPDTPSRAERSDAA